MSDNTLAAVLQEKRRAERAEQQRIRAEKEKERQARREVGHYSLQRDLELRQGLGDERHLTRRCQL